MHYVIQENVFREVNYNRLSQNLRRLGMPYEVVRSFPYVDKIVRVEEIPDGPFEVDELPDFNPPNDKIFVFGSIKLARLGAKLGWKPGSLLNDNHDYLIYGKYYDMLNSDSEIVKVYQNLQWKPKEKKFIRPCKDNKIFTGKVFDEGDWKEAIERMVNLKVPSDNLIQVCSTKDIWREVRTWIVDGKVICASQYKTGSRVVAEEFIDEDGLAFAQKMADKFHPAEAFVLDICDTPNGWKVVEVNCINSAGFYAADLQKLIISLEEKFN